VENGNEIWNRFENSDKIISGLPQEVFETKSRNGIRVLKSKTVYGIAAKLFDYFNTSRTN